MTLLEICEFIEKSYIGTSIRESNYYWMLNGVHVLGLGISVGAIFWFDLRAMGVNMRHMRVSEVYKQINNWMLGGFAAMVITGALLFWARAASSGCATASRATTPMATSTWWRGSWGRIRWSSLRR